MIKNYPKKKQPIHQQTNFKPPNCPHCKRNIWLDFAKGYFRQNCDDIINKQKYQVDKKILGQDHNFSTKLPYAKEKIWEIYYSMANSSTKWTDDMIDKLQNVKRKTKLKYHKNKRIFYDNMNIRMDEDPFTKNAQSIGKIYHDVLLLRNFLQTKPQVDNMSIKFYDL